MVEQHFKMTEVGLIPEDWEVKSIGSITEKIVGGGTPSRSVTSYWKGCIPWATVKDLNNFNSHATQEYISRLALKNSASNLIQKRTIITSTRMALGRAVMYEVDVAINQDLKALFFDKTVSKKFIYYWFCANSKNIIDKGSGSTVMGISLTELKAFIIALPNLPEQRAIATALSDADSWIESLEKLLAKKRLIKQGAMQQLLTPGEDWEVRKLGEVSEIYTGKKNNQDKVVNGKYPFFVRSQQIERINSYSFDGEAILIPGEGNIGKIFHYINGKFDYHQRVYKISDFKESYSGKYIYRFIAENFGRHAMENSVKATVDSLRLPTFQVFEIPFPPTIEEQIRIATILSDMDAEIESLEKKLQKAKQIKQGMMQLLLTGKVRLVGKEESLEV